MRRVGQLSQMPEFVSLLPHTVDLEVKDV